jgi:hypothetical protein
MTNPYRLSTTDFTILYNGEVGEYHSYRIVTKGHKGMDVLMFKNKVVDWLMHSCNGQWKAGHGFDDISLFNADGRDFFVLMERMSDIAQFEHMFPVRGFTPLMVA